MTRPNGRYPNHKRIYPSKGSTPFDASYREEAIRRLAPSRATVLLVGGSSIEKSFVAHALHDRSPRVQGPFVVVDCAATAANSLEEVLFGELFYGVTSRSPAAGPPRAAVRDAERGTLYIAAIDILPMPLQPRFLHFLDEAVAIRVVASSDGDLLGLASQGRFRPDLAERLSLVCVYLSGRSVV